MGNGAGIERGIVVMVRTWPGHDIDVVFIEHRLDFGETGPRQSIEGLLPSCALSVDHRGAQCEVADFAPNANQLRGGNSDQ